MELICWRGMVQLCRAAQLLSDILGCLIQGRRSACVQAKNGKVKGPLPMTLAQLIVLGIFGGITYAFTAKAEASANFVQAAVEAMISTYQKLEAAVIQRTSKDKSYVSELREPSGKDAVQPEA